VRNVLKSESGSDSKEHEIARANGWHDIAQCDLCVYALGINDAVRTGTATATIVSEYLASLTAFWNWYRNRYPSGKMIVLGVAPLENNADETNAVALRSAASGFVANAASSMLGYINLGAAFDRAGGTTVYVTTDTAGSRIHPNNASHIAIGNVIATGWQALGWTL
jgi:lysophospholipase L1-like esterase